MGQGAFGVDDCPRSAAARELGAAAVIVGREPCVHVQRDPGIGGARIIAQDIDEIGVSAGIWPSSAVAAGRRGPCR